MKALSIQLKLALRGLIAAGISSSATAPLAPFIVLTVLFVGDRHEFTELANPFCILLGTAIAMVVALFMSLTILTPLALLLQKGILGKSFHRFFIGFIVLAVALTIGAYAAGMMDSSYPSSHVYEFGLLVSGIMCQILGTTLYFTLFRKGALQVMSASQAERFEPKLPPIPARIQGIDQYCRIGRRLQGEYVSKETYFPLPITTEI